MNTEMGLCEQEKGIQPDNKKTFNFYHIGHSDHVRTSNYLRCGPEF